MNPAALSPVVSSEYNPTSMTATNEETSSRSINDVDGSITQQRQEAFGTYENNTTAHSSFYEWMILMLGCVMFFSICLAPVERNRLKPLSNLFTSPVNQMHKLHRHPAPVKPLNYTFFGLLTFTGVLLALSLVYMLFFEEDSLAWFDENLQERCLLHSGTGEPPPLRTVISGEGHYSYRESNARNDSATLSSDTEDNDNNLHPELDLSAMAFRRRRQKTLTAKDFLNTTVEIGDGSNEDAASTTVHIVTGLPKLAAITTTLLPPHHHHHHQRFSPTVLSNGSDNQIRKVH